MLQVLVGLLADAEQLASSVHSTSELSERVSFKVRELDTAQSRINEDAAAHHHCCGAIHSCGRHSQRPGCGGL